MVKLNKYELPDPEVPEASYSNLAVYILDENDLVVEHQRNGLATGRELKKVKRGSFYVARKRTASSQHSMQILVMKSWKK